MIIKFKFFILFSLPCKVLWCGPSADSHCSSKLKIDKHLQLIIRAWSLCYHVYLVNAFQFSKVWVSKSDKQKSLILHTYHIENTQIKSVSSATYLGVTIDSKLSWNNHIQRITSKANQVNALFYRNLRQCPIGVTYRAVSAIAIRVW